MNKNKIAFITCVNDEETYAESELYLGHLTVPTGYSLEMIAVRGAPSMTAGYNFGQRQSDAKYKIYLHQDVYLIKRDILSVLLNIFQTDKSVGLIGLAGSRMMPDSLIWWEDRDIYLDAAQVLSSENLKITKRGRILFPWEEFSFVDGMFMATQYDLPWSEDVFSGWHYYDVSQCENFTASGYKIVIPRQDEPWCVHECGSKDLHDDFFYWREVYGNWRSANKKIT